MWVKIPKRCWGSHLLKHKGIQFTLQNTDIREALVSLLKDNFDLDVILNK